MIKFSKLFETVHEPRSGDEKNFKDKHIAVKTKTPYDTESQFTSDKSKAKRKADANDDEEVYESADVHTKRKDKEAVIVRRVDPKTGQSKAKTEWRPSGEVKVEEVEQIDELSDDKLRSYHAKAGADRMKAKAKVEKGMAAKKFTPASVQKTTDAYKRFIKRGKGMTAAANKMSEEVELEESVNASDYTTHGTKSQFGGYRAEVKHKTKGHTMYLGSHGYDTAEKAKGEADAYLKGYSAEGGRGNENHAARNANEHAKKYAISGTHAKKRVNEALDEKVKNPYAVGMAAAMKATGDTPPLKKSTIVKGHEIAKSIKNEALDPVGKADADINNDGKVDSTDKYLHNRRKAIAKSMKEDLDKEVEQIDEISKKTLGSYVKKASSDMASNAYALGANDPLKKPGAWDKAFKRKAGIEKATDKLTKEEVEQIDELSPNTLHSYIKKAAGNMAGNAAVAAAQASSSMKKSSPDVKRNIVNRMKGITGASGRLADKANMAEETDTGENTADLDNSSFKNYIKSNKPSKVKNVTEADAKTNSEVSHKKYIKSNVKAPHESFKEEVEDLDEAFKVGAMRLKDGSSVTLTRESVDLLNGLFHQLNSANKAKMEERMMADKKGFKEILSFAENI